MQIDNAADDLEFGRDRNVAFLRSAMRMLYSTVIVNHDLAAKRGLAIRTVDEMLVMLGEKSCISEMAFVSERFLGSDD